MDAVDLADSRWRRAYLLGGVFMGLVLAGTVADIVLGSVLGADLSKLPQTAAARFALSAEKPWLGLYLLDLLNVVLSLLTLPAYLAIAGALRRTALPLAALGLLVFLVSTAVFVSGNAALPMLDLSRKFAQATDPAQRAALMGAGEALLARGAHGSLGVFFAFAGSTVGSLLLSLSMLGGEPFSRRTGILGLVAFPLLLTYVVLVTFVPTAGTVALALSAPGGILALVWEGVVAARLLRLGRQA